MLGNVVVAGKRARTSGLFAGGWFPTEPHVFPQAGHSVGSGVQSLL